ncbi:7386_t:CDS:2, partial [Gigaspora margarita]
QMDIDHDNELSKQLMLYHKILNPEINYSEVPKSYDWVQNYRLIVAIQSLREEYIIWPHEDYRKEINQEFENLGFPMAIGAIDGTHIPLNEAPSKINKDTYISRKHRYGIHLQGINEDYLLGDSAYPLLPWVMMPFKDLQGLNAEQQKYYNTVHSKARVVIEQAFGRLKARFPFLKEMRIKVQPEEQKL